MNKKQTSPGYFGIFLALYWLSLVLPKLQIAILFFIFNYLKEKLCPLEEQAVKSIGINYFPKKKSLENRRLNVRNLI
jgi:hypothetical protein